MPRLDTDLLDPDDPFELDDGNIPKLCSRAPFTAEDAFDVFFGDPEYFEYVGEGQADWIMVGHVPGGPGLPRPGPVVVAVALCKPNSGSVSQARPVSIYLASQYLREQYLAGRQ